MPVFTHYKCRQSELYTILRLGWNSVTANLATFTAFSAAYTALLVTARQTAIDSAEALPDYQARNSIAELLRNDLVDLSPSILSAFQQLKRYIKHAFAPNDRQAMYDAAGLGY